MSNCTAESGTCSTCRDACAHKPGWFMPGEPERAAELLGVTLAELFRTRLVVDYWYGDERLSPTTFTLSPRMASCEPGTLTGLHNQGRCTFLTEDGRCEIHAAKPTECAEWYCGSDDDTLTPHVEIARAWQAHQAQIAELLGHTPELPELSIFDVFDFTMGLLDRMVGDR